MKKRILSMILALAMVLSLGLSVFAEGEETEADIVDAAFALEPGASLEGTKTLTGTVSSIATPYSATNQNVTVNIHVLDGSGNTRTIQCYKIKGDDAATVGVGDVITVTGTITNYNGLIEFKANSTFITVSKATGDYQIKTFAGYSTEDVAIVVRQEGKTTIGEVTGKDYNYYRVILVDADGYVVEVLEKLGRVPQTPTEENPAHGPEDGRKDLVEIPEGGFAIGIHNNVIVADGSAYASLFGEGGVKAGDSIVVYGVDFEELATMAAQTALEGASFSVVPAFVAPTTEEEILAAAFALDPGTALPGGPYSLTGVVNKKTDNKTQVNITVGDKDVLCYQMNADDYAAIAVGDTVIVTGNIKNYNGVVEFDTGCTAEIVDIYFTDAFEGAEVINVTAENGRWQNPKEPELLTYTLELADDGEYLYVRVVGDAKFADEISTFRFWIRSNDEATIYTHFYDVDIAADGTVTNKAKYNTSLTENKGANIENSGMEFAAKATEDEKTLIVFRVPLAEFNGASGFAYYSALMFKGVDYSYYPAPAGTDIANMPYKLWDAENEGLYKKVHPITENILDLEELKIIDVITFTADDPSIGTVRVAGSVDGEEYYDLNNNGAANVNADTGVASVALTTQGYIQIRYIKVTGTDVHGEITATFKEAAEGAFIAPPAGPYDFGSTNAQGYGIVMLENRVVDINAVKGEDYVVAVKNNQLIITQKVANGVYKIIANSVNAYPSQGHPELITAGIEGLNIDEDGIITLADDQFAFVIVSSGSIKTAGDEQTAPAKRIDRGLGVNGYWRVDGDKVTLHVNQPEPVEEPVEDPIQPAELETLPEGAIAIDYAGYKHAAFTSIIAGDGQTVAQLTARGNDGKAKDLNYAYNILVGADNVVIATDYALGTPNTWTCPEGGYIITYNGNKAGYQVMADIEVGATITVYNVNLAPVRTLEGNVELTSAGFTYVNPEPAGEEVPEGAAEIFTALGWGSDLSAIVVRLESGEKTLGEIRAVTGENAYEWWVGIVVDSNNKVVKILPMGNKESEEVPEGGYIIVGHGSSNALTAINSANVGDVITLYNVDLAAIAKLDKAVNLVNAAFTVTPNPDVEYPISKDKTYTISGSGVGQGSYTANLTDGAAYDAMSYDNKWFAFGTTNMVDGVGSVTVDLGEAYWVSKFDSHHVSENQSGVAYPSKGVISVSLDGVNFTEVGSLAGFKEELPTGNSTCWASLELAESVKARYVRFEYTIGVRADEGHVGSTAAFAFVNEVEVWEGEEGVEPVEPFKVTVTVKDNAILTDGRTGFDGNWGTVGTGDVLLVANSECTTAPMEVTIIDELDEVMLINGVTLDLYHCANVMIGYPEGKASVFVSVDGEEYTPVDAFDLTAAALSTGSYGTVSSTFEFAAEAKFIKIVLNAGSNADVLGDNPADGKVNWEFISIAEITVSANKAPLSLHKSYTVAKSNGEATYWSNSSLDLKDDGVRLTDGSKGNPRGDTLDYTAVNGLKIDNDNFAYTIITVDLGEAKFVDTFATYTCGGNWGISAAGFVKVKTSLDGSSFTEAGYAEGAGALVAGTGEADSWSAYKHEIILENSVSARYVQFEVYTFGQFCWIDEVEVYEGEEPEPMGDTTIDGVFDDDIWEAVEWTTYDGYTKGTWQTYVNKGTHTFKIAFAEDEEYIYFAGEVSCLDVTKVRIWFHNNPEASLYTHFIDVFPDKASYIKKNQSLTTNDGATIEGAFLEYQFREADGKTFIEIKAKKADLDITDTYEAIPQVDVTGFSTLHCAEIIHGNFVYGGETMTYFEWKGWPAAPEETYVGLIPVTNHWTFTDVTSNEVTGVIDRAHYERQEDGSLRFVVGGTDLWPLVSYNYEEAKVYNVARGTLHYDFTLNGHNTNITFIFEDANGAPYTFPLANTALGLEDGQYNASSGDFILEHYEGSVALADLVASSSLYGNNPFPEADATELKFIGIQIYACVTDPAGGVYIDDLSVTEEAAPEVNENVMDLGEVVTITGVTFTADNPDGLETVEILGSIDGVNYYRLNSEPAVTVTDGVATVNFAMANNNFRAFLNIRYIKVVGAPNVEGEIDIIEAAEEDVVKGIAPQGPYTQTGLNTSGYGIVVWTAEDAPEGFGLNEKGVYTDHDKALNLNSCMITIAEEVDEGVYKILWNDSNGWTAGVGANHTNTPEGVEGVDYRDGKVYLGENQIAMFIMSSGGYNTAGDGEFSTAKWILRGIVEGGYLRFGDETVEFFNEQPAAVASQEELSIADFDGDGDIDSDDAIYLLRAVLFPEDYEITLATPFYGDRNPTSDDAIYLLRHVLFPKDYPIPKE